MLHLDQLILNEIAHQTANSVETPTESFALHNHGLIYSLDYSRVILPVFNVQNVKEVISTVTLMHYMKSRYGSEIILVLDPRLDKYVFMFELFSDYYDHLFKRKRHLELAQIARDMKATKFVYGKSLHLYPWGELTKYIKEPIKISEENINLDEVSKIQANQILLSRGANSDEDLSKVNKLLYKNGFIQTVDINHSNLHQGIYDLLVSDGLINIYSNKDIDFLAPFTGVRITQCKTRLYNNKIFDFSLSHMSDKINELKI